jgi:hypothetical protein
MEYVSHENTDETFIVQNITLNYHFVSDIGLQFKPREVLDLTWEDPTLIKKSRNLKDSLRSGILKKLTPEEYDKTMRLQYEREKKELAREQEKNQQKYRKVKTSDGDEFQADTFDPMKRSQKKNDEVDITGIANHPMSYVAAFEIAQTIAAERGDLISAEEFATLVDQNPNIVPGLLAKTRQAEAEIKTHSSYYAVPMGDGATQTGVVKANTNSLKTSRNGSYLNEQELEEKSGYLLDAIDLSAMERQSYRDDLDVDLENLNDDDDVDFSEVIDLENDIEDKGVK